MFRRGGSGVLPCFPQRFARQGSKGVSGSCLRPGIGRASIRAHRGEAEMDITLAGFVLFLHISIVITSFMIAGFLHAAFPVPPRTRSIAEMRPWAALMPRLEPLLPILAIGILAMGAWLVHLEHGDGVEWSDGWVLTPLISLIAIEALAGIVLAPRTKALCERVA